MTAEQRIARSARRAGCDAATARRLAAERRHPGDWGDWRLRVWRCGDQWVATWRREMVVCPDPF